MEITIKSRENGWETERKVELPDDEKLVKAIIRSVKRHTDPPKAAGGGIDPVIREEAGESGTTAEQPEETPKVPETGRSEQGYRGFLLVRCGGCGRVYAYNAREEATESTCRECGHVTPLQMLAQASFKCPSCKETWNYKTNLVEADATCRCILCGAEMHARWHKKLRKYIPVE